MMTSARPMAMSKSRVQTRISLRSVFAEDAAPLAAPPEALAATGSEDRSESGFSGEVSAPRCFWSERSIVGASVIYSMAAAARASCDFSHVAQKSRRIRRRSIRRSQAVWLESQWALMLAGFKILGHQEHSLRRRARQ